MTRSTGCSGLMRCGSPPSFALASRIAARSTTAGTPVKSWSSTRAVRNAVSFSTLPLTPQRATAPMSARLAHARAPSRPEAAARGVGALRVAAELRDGVAHRGQVDGRGYAGEVLEQYTSRAERDLLLDLALHVPARHCLDGGAFDERAVLVPEKVLEKDLE